VSFIEAREIRHRYDGRWVLDRVNLSVERGEVFALIGPSAAGKTTLLRLLDLLEKPAEGQVLFDGIDPGALEKTRVTARRRMAFVQQKPVLFRMSVEENVAMGPLWRGERGARLRARVAGVLELVGLEAQKHRDGRTLSGGEARRAALARALATEPELLFLDEPTANLDPVSIAKVELIIARVIEERKVTVVMATHDMLQGQRLAGRIGVLIDGELLQVGRPQEIFLAPGNRRVAEFVGAAGEDERTKKRYYEEENRKGERP
jgi:tungstate transport system ATP-binding protein